MTKTKSTSHETTKTVSRVSLLATKSHCKARTAKFGLKPKVINQKLTRLVKKFALRFEIDLKFYLSICSIKIRPNQHNFAKNHTHVDLELIQYFTIQKPSIPGSDYLIIDSDGPDTKEFNVVHETLFKVFKL